MNKFITVTGSVGTYSFNVEHIICITKEANNKAIIYHTVWGNNVYRFYTNETYDEVMEMING